MLARRQIRLAIAAIVGALVDVNVQSPGDWETIGINLPEVKLRNRSERKLAVSRQAAAFTTTVTLELLARAQGCSEAEAQDAIEDLGERIEQALIASPALLSWLQQISAITTQTAVTATGTTHLGEALITFECETFEAFDPLDIDPTALRDLQTVMLNLDTARPFDAAGTYSAEHPFPDAVAAAPRATGPDGRNEGRAEITLNP